MGTAFMSLSNVFDTINHDLLIANLEVDGFFQSALSYVFSYSQIDLKREVLISHLVLGKK